VLTYVHFYNDETGEYLDHGKILDIEPTVGYVHQRYTKEGYIPWEIVKIEDKGTTFGDNPFIGATVKIHPFVKTHCDHEWKNSNVFLLSSPPKHTRICNKCNKKETFSYGTAKWE
jgi:hypothetical protein